MWTYIYIYTMNVFVIMNDNIIVHWKWLYCFPTYFLQWVVYFSVYLNQFSLYNFPFWLKYFQNILNTSSESSGIQNYCLIDIIHKCRNKRKLLGVKFKQQDNMYSAFFLVKYWIVWSKVWELVLCHFIRTLWSSIISLCTLVFSGTTSDFWWWSVSPVWEWHTWFTSLNCDI